jgi:hypothetical protein
VEPPHARHAPALSQEFLNPTPETPLEKIRKKLHIPYKFFNYKEVINRKTNNICHITVIFERKPWNIDKSFIKVQGQDTHDTMRREINTFEVLITLKSKPSRTRYLWANAVIVDDTDPRCPLIEG